MKKLRLILSSQDSDWVDAPSEGNGVKWDFKANPELVCVLLDRKTLPNKKGGGTYDLYRVKHFTTKEAYVIFSNVVLGGKLKQFPIGSCVRIKFLGTPPGKEYFDFGVQFDRNFKFNPAEWEGGSFEDGKSTEQVLNENKKQPTGQQQKPAQTNTTTTQTFDDDLPF